MNSLILDLYELTMGQVYFDQGIHQKKAVFDLFFRRNPDQAAYSVYAGLSQLIETVQSFHFNHEEIEYLKNTGLFSEAYLNYLANLKFNLNIYSQREGEIIFPNEPLIIVEGELLQCQLLETSLLIAINHQSLIATKANRIVQSAKDKLVFELGARRAHNFDSAYYGARAAYIGGAHASATVKVGKDFNIPIVGTMAHAFVQAFGDEYQAFLSYAKTYPDNTVLLLDTYNTIDSGLKNAIKLHHEYLKPMGKSLKAVRIDSGDIAYLSKKIRSILDQNQMEETKIIASNSLDEYLIKSLLDQNAQIDIFGVGENLICAKSSPVFGGVYKLVSIEENDYLIPTIKLSDSVEKMINPSFKKLYRIFDAKTHNALADIMFEVEELVDQTKDLTIYHPNNPWKYKTYPANSYYLEALLIPIFQEGKLVYQSPSLEKIRNYKIERLNLFWDELKRFTNPHEYYVDISKQLSDLKSQMIAKYHQK